MNRFRTVRPGIAALFTLIFAALNPAVYAAGSKLRLEQLIADEASIYTVAVEVVGPTEILLWDCQFHVADAKRLADQIASSGKHLKAIVISHPDGDHYYGAAVILERFPGTPVYMTAAALDTFNRNAEKSFMNGKARTPDLLPDRLVTPQVLPSLHLTVDGEDVEVIPDLQGDMATKLDSLLWIPSLRAILAGDLVFSGVHPYLASSSEKARTDWRESCKRMSDLHPTIVVAGHKKAADDSPDVLNFMDRYLADFEAARSQSPDAQALVAAMTKKYPDLALPRFLQSAANAAYAAK
jgi:glyoxylase-like metal-dependent hydrolase (beta-lactamase superfamily II)